ncbi:hypothetical protein HK104_011239 [Borealophlyctis nickersoniae]|nr:hypothetical protein HK104_011239 [Borealophlyctis nickersoniae]
MADYRPSIDTPYTPLERISLGPLSEEKQNPYTPTQQNPPEDRNIPRDHSTDPLWSTARLAPSRRRVLALLLAANAVTFIFTLVPVLVNMKGFYRGEWYGGNDIIRLLEPIVVLPINFAILYESGIFAGHPSEKRREPIVVAALFMIFAAIYQQGAGFHSAANMFKHSVEQFAEDHPEVAAQYPDLKDIYSWMRDTWEHVISHYMYAAGGIATAFVFAYVYRNVEAPAFDNWKDRTLWILATVLYGLTIGSVAIEFPKGSIVALVLILVYGFGILGTVLWRKGGALVWGRRYVLQYYVMSYIIGLVIVIGWIIYAKGFNNREESGVKFG